MDLNLAFHSAFATSKRNRDAGPWDWEANCSTAIPDLFAPLAVAISWIASKFSHTTVPALRAACV
jgi:hypothetical protein